MTFKHAPKPRRIPKGSGPFSKGPPAQAGNPNKPARPDYDRASILRAGGKHRGIKR